MSETRAACWRLWVTITTVNSRFSSCTSSSMRAAPRGSREAVGSSSRITSGCGAMVRATQSRCCWPPESASGESPSRSFTSSQRAACRSARSTTPARSLREMGGPTLRPAATLSAMDIVGKGVGFWNTIHTVRRTAIGLTSLA